MSVKESNQELPTYIHTLTWLMALIIIKSGALKYLNTKDTRNTK